jgi:hypothetical protein
MGETITGESVFDIELVERALPVIDGVIVRRSRHWKLALDARDDVRSEVFVRLVKRLKDDDSGPIGGFEEYVAGVTSRVIDDVIRSAAPEWARLKHRVRYVLTHDDRFRVAAFADGRILCALRSTPLLGQKRVQTQAAMALAETMIDLMRGHEPRTVDELVSAVAQRTGIAEPAQLDADSVAAVHLTGAESAVESAQYFARLWSEILQLPPRQRLALLLNARDAAGESVLRLLISETIVSAREIAAALDVREAELDALWSRLPLMDAAIAERLRVTRQQVINLRKAARDRLARRMARLR